MSTRATYSFPPKPEGRYKLPGSMTFYAHYDGYPTGAAQRFANMIAQLTVPETDADREYRVIEDRRGGFVFAFIRGNMDVESTEGHEAHGDTEYRYTLAADPKGAAGIQVEHRSVSDDQRRWRLIYSGDLAEWINLQRGELAKQLRAYKARSPDQYSGDPEADALDAIPVIVRKIESRDAGMGNADFVTYATYRNAVMIEGIERKMVERYAADNRNKRYHEARAKAWTDAIGAAAVVALAPVVATSG